MEKVAISPLERAGIIKSASMLFSTLTWCEVPKPFGAALDPFVITDTQICEGSRV